MSGKGWVTTARGGGLNIDDLIAKSQRPIGLKEENSTIKKREIPGGRKPINVRGFQPAQGEVRHQDAPAPLVKEKPTHKSAFKAGNEAKSKADLTGIKVKRRASTKKPTGSAEEAASEALGDIMTGLEASSPNAAAAADQEEKKPTRRKSSK